MNIYKYSGLLGDVRVRSLRSFNQNYACIMLSFFCLMPMLAMFSPKSFGSIFKTFSYIEIVSLLVLGLFQLVSYASFETRSFRLSERIKICFANGLNSLINNKTGLLLLVVYMLTVISAVFAKDTQRALYGTDFRPDGVFMHTSFAVVFIYASLVKDKLHRRIIFGINMLGFFCSSLIMLQQYYGILGTAGVKSCGSFGRMLMDIYREQGIRTGHFFKGLTGPFYNLNHMGYYIMINSMIISAYAVISEKWYTKLAFAVFAAYSYYILTINNTFGCYLAVMLALVLVPLALLLKFRKRGMKLFLNSLIPLALFIIVALGFFAFETADNVVSDNFKTLTSDVKEVATSVADSEDLTQGEAGSGRMPLWIATIDMIGEKPLLGYGPDNLKADYVEREIKVDRAHNEPLERAVSTGIPSALIYYAAIIWGALKFPRRKFTIDDKHMLISFSLLVAYLISSLFGVFLFYTAGYFIIALAFVCSDGFGHASFDIEKPKPIHKKR